MNTTYQHDSLENSDFTLNSILDIIVEGIWDWHANTGCVDRSPSWYKMLGYDIGVFSKDIFTWENIIHPDDYSKVMNHFELYISGKIEQYEIEYRCKKSDNSYLWITDRGKIVSYNEDGSVARMIGAHQNIHLQKMTQCELIEKNQFLHEGNSSLEKLLEEKNRELEEKNNELEKKILEIKYLSETDALTEISNRRKFQVEIEKEIARSNRYGHDLSFVIFDIDLFKNINDRYGHHKGDIVLKKLASFVKNQLRINDFIARWGGEEFALLLPSTNLDGAIELSEKLRSQINSIDFGNEIFITCSFGIAQYRQNDSTDQLFTNADIALYKAKELGRNRVECSNCAN
jgi:diguanylate cyclase (GGDEF)-like protein/PAS domain S-box-containing protein